MAEEEKDPERRLRILAMVKELRAATDNKMVNDVQTALANTVAMMCMSVGQDADEMFLSTQAVMIEVFMAYRARAREGKPVEIMN